MLAGGMVRPVASILHAEDSSAGLAEARKQAEIASAAEPCAVHGSGVQAAGGNVGAHLLLQPFQDVRPVGKAV